MRKFYVLYIFIVMPFLQGTSQVKSNSFKGTANYSIKLAEDDFYFKGKLIFSRNKSSFIYKKNKKQKWYLETDKTYQKVYTDSLGYQVFTDLVSKELQVREFCRLKQPFIYTDKVAIKWKLEDKQKEIGGLQCAKASTRFRGRDYIVWYALEVPTSAGPWKFNGLPGLIISVKDKRGEVSMSLQSLKLGTQTDFHKLGSGTEISFKGFRINMDEAYLEEYKKNDARIAQVQSEFPDIEVHNNMSEKRIATETEFE